MRIITIGREFGSGGRELGKRLAESLGVPCYDKQILREAALLQGITQEHVQRISLADVRRVYPATIGRSFSASGYRNEQAVNLFVSQQQVIRRLAEQGDCVFVGRSADILLADLEPLNLFVYADMESRLRRCLDRAEEAETEKTIRRQMQRMDKERAANRRLVTDSPWGRRESYHLCLNTSGWEIKEMIPALASYCNAWFTARGK